MQFKNEEKLLKLALKNGKIVSVTDVENGKACACICPECNSPLIARNKGKIRTAHFAHIYESNCVGSIESALHLLSKEILNETKKIFIPNYKHYYLDLELDAIILNHIITG